MYITLARPKHWLKNILVFVPIIYARNIIKPDLFLLTIQCFFAFCLISSAVYVINDILDVEKDREHPIKSNRPIASGQVAINKAIVMAVILFGVGFFLTITGYGNNSTALFAALYFLLNLAYSFKLKHYAIVDCFCIAAGFVLRVYAGGAASNNRITEWLFLTIMAVSLFVAFGKRRGEMMLIPDVAGRRKVLDSYEPDFLNGMIFMCAGLSVIFYALWAMQSVSSMIYTVPLVIFIICKYLLTLRRSTFHDDPITIILGDNALIIAISIFGLLSVGLLYFSGESVL